MPDAEAPTCMISWAHRGSGWSSAEVETWTRTVVRFATLLRESGIDAELDLWHLNDPSIDWTRWGQRRIVESDFVVVVINAPWRQRWEGTNTPTEGAGAVAEADTLKGMFQENQAAFQRKVLLVSLPGTSNSDIPYDLYRLLRFRIEHLMMAGLTELVETLRGSSAVRPELAALPKLPQGNAVDALAVITRVQGAEESLNSVPEPVVYGSEEATARALRQLKLSTERGLLSGLGLSWAHAEAEPDQATQELVPLSDEQQAVANHPIDQHGVVLAGPGTGKSLTILRLAANLSSEGDGAVRVVTFTRAATAELLANLSSSDQASVRVTTLHSFALALLTRYQSQVALPSPLRIPDRWEESHLLWPELAARLRLTGFADVSVRDVRRLVDELAASWEALDPDLVLLSQVDPALRAAFRAAWFRQRDVFGYTHFAEMMFTARDLLQDLLAPDLQNLRLLVVDEFQDLNRAEIQVLEALAGHGVSILAVGDDDQSIYSFRLAAPNGIREFRDNPHFPSAAEYHLSLSFRCGSVILAAANELIGSSPVRAPKPQLAAAASNGEGEMHYLRFGSSAAETAGVARLVKYLVEVQGLALDQVIILMRSDHNGTWSSPIRDALARQGLPVVDVDSVLEPLSTSDARRLLALARLATGEDELSWWALLKLTPGIGDSLAVAIADDISGTEMPFHERLERLAAEPLSESAGVSRRSVRLACELVDQVRGLRQSALNLLPPERSAGQTWADWMSAFASLAGVGMEEALVDLLHEAGNRATDTDGLSGFIDSLEQVAREVALEAPAVALMTMGLSKGLTRDAVVVVGVEEGVLPRADSDLEEQRRLLYVAMTRPRKWLYLTMAANRTGPTARSGGAVIGQRLRSSFFRGGSVQVEDGAVYLRQLLGG